MTGGGTNVGRMKGDGMRGDAAGREGNRALRRPLPLSLQLL